MSRSVHAGLQV